jgi:hypothetical protein
MKKKNLKLIDGQEKKFSPSSLDQVWGATGLDKYETFDLEEYKSTLKELNLSDLQSHASKIGIIPCNSRDMITKELVKQFLAHTGSFRQPKQSKISKALSKEAAKILSEGR